MLIHAPSISVILSSQGFLCSGRTSAEWGLVVGLGPFCLVIWAVAAVKALFKVVQDLQAHDIVLMIVMLECGVMALMIQVRVWHHMCLYTMQLNSILWPLKVSFSFSVQICDNNYTYSLPNPQEDNSQSSWQVNAMQKTYIPCQKWTHTRFSEPICARRNGLSTTLYTTLF